MLNQDPAALDRVFHALTDPARRQMLERLTGGPASVSTLAEPLTMSLPAVMQHLKVLEEAGLLRSEKVGRVRTCRAVPDALARAQRWIDARRALWEKPLDRLGPTLAADDDLV